MGNFAVLSTLLFLITTVTSAPTVFGGYSYPSSYLRELSGKLRDLRDPADLECESCKVIVAALQQLMLQNATENEIVNIITRICIDLKIQDQNVCTLAVLEFKVLISVRGGVAARL